MEPVMAKKTLAAPLPTPLPENLSPRQSAVFLNLSVNQLAKWRHQGGGPAWSRIGERRIVYRLEDLRAFVASGLRKGA